MQTYRPSRTVRTAIAAMLLAALLFAQWIGLAHRIAHAGWLQAHVLIADMPAPQTDSESGKAAGHSCVALDAATLADTVHVPPFLVPALTSMRVLALWTAFASWDAPPSLAFSSRAPPLS